MVHSSGGLMRWTDHAFCRESASCPKGWDATRREPSSLPCAPSPVHGGNFVLPSSIHCFEPLALQLEWRHRGRSHRCASSSSMPTAGCEAACPTAMCSTSDWRATMLWGRRIVISHTKSARGMVCRSVPYRRCSARASSRAASRE